MTEFKRCRAATRMFLRMMGDDKHNLPRNGHQLVIQRASLQEVVSITNRGEDNLEEQFLVEVESFAEFNSKHMIRM